MAKKFRKRDQSQNAEHDAFNPDNFAIQYLRDAGGSADNREIKWDDEGRKYIKTTESGRKARFIT
jgi:hypothetical protein